ncbi:hypothetical protein [Streptococcus mitis]|uniref:hypothetical protein n=1 Tax=Streptococcus mitis TaxID=28037 RepID=UPI0039C27D67
MNNLENLATAIGTDIKDIKTQATNSQAKISANTESIARIATQMDSLATKSEVKQDIDGLTQTFAKMKVGGRNYYLDSEKVRTSTRFFPFPLHPYLSQENIGETWTLSFDLKINENGEIRPLHFYHYQNNRFGLKASADITPSREWQRFTFTGPVIFPNDDPRYSRGEMALYDYGGNNNYSVRRIKLEKGTLATDWSPAPEDAQTQVTETQESLRGLERKFETVASDVKVLNQKPEPRLTLAGNTLSIAGGNNVTLPIPENVGVEIRGTGSPEGRITAEIGTTYVDVNATNGALKWIKESGNGNTGWKVLIGDTGWRTLDSVSKFGNSFVKIRRVNNLVTYQFGGLDRGLFGIVRRGGVGYVGQNGTRGVRVLQPDKIPEGFRSESSLIGNIFDDRGAPYGIFYVGGKSDSNFIHFTFNENIPTSKDVTDIRVGAISYLTDEAWPTTLP